MEQLRDISNNNSGLTRNDFLQWKEDGVVGVYLKVTEGLSFADKLAPQFRQWAKEIGLLYGEYHFFRPAVSGVEQAKWFLAHSHDDAELLPALDVEVEDGVPWNRLNGGALSWLLSVEAERKCRPLVYTYPSFALHLVKLTGYPLWISDPDRKGGKPRIYPWKRWVLWQDDTRVLDKDSLCGDVSSVCRGKPVVPAADLRARTGYWSWVCWRLGEGLWRGWGRANAAVRPTVPVRVRASWWAALAAFVRARRG